MRSFYPAPGMDNILAKMRTVTVTLVRRRIGPNKEQRSMFINKGDTELNHLDNTNTGHDAIKV